MTPAGCIQLFSQISDSLQWGEPASLKKSLNEILALNAKAVIIALFTGNEKSAPDDYDRLKRSYDEQKAQLITCTGYGLPEVVE